MGRTRHDIVPHRKDASRCRCVRPERLHDLEAAEDSRFRPTRVTRLPSLFESAGGLCDVLSDVRDPPGYMAWAMHETMLLLHDLVVRTTGNALYRQRTRGTSSVSCKAKEKRVPAGHLQGG